MARNICLSRNHGLIEMVTLQVKPVLSVLPVAFPDTSFRSHVVISVEMN